ncbi:MAG: hypothetical protein VYE67_13880 [Planctomycetota bacterium]|nr:hypothetical protein [Planctomycetota bacterium]
MRRGNRGEMDRRVGDLKLAAFGKGIRTLLIVIQSSIFSLGKIAAQSFAWQSC